MNHLIYLFALWLVATMSAAEPSDNGVTPVYQVRPIGWVRKADGNTTIEVDRQYEPGLLGVEDLAYIWVLYWFDRNDTAERRAILQVHPRGNP